MGQSSRSPVKIEAAMEIAAKVSDLHAVEVLRVG